jgi:hypothetical protein
MPTAAKSVKEPPKRQPSLVVRAQGVTYPHDGRKRPGFDPRLAEWFAVLAEVLRGDDDDALRQVLCGGIWWLGERDALEALACDLRQLLAQDPQAVYWEDLPR